MLNTEVHWKSYWWKDTEECHHGIWSIRWLPDTRALGRDESNKNMVMEDQREEGCSSQGCALFLFPLLQNHLFTRICDFFPLKDRMHDLFSGCLCGWYKDEGKPFLNASSLSLLPLLDSSCQETALDESQKWMHCKIGRQYPFPTNYYPWKWSAQLINRALIVK